MKRIVIVLALLAASAAQAQFNFPTAPVNAVQLQGRAVSANPPSNNQVLTWITANNDWEPAAGGGGSTGNWLFTNNDADRNAAGALTIGAGGNASSLTVTPATKVIGALTVGPISNQLLLGAAAHLVTISSTAPAAAAQTLTIPDTGGNDTFDFLALAQIFTGAKTFSASIAINGGLSASGANANNFGGGTGTFTTSTGAFTSGSSSATFNGTNTSGALETVSPGAASSGTQGVVAWTMPASTGQTASTEINGFIYTAGTRTWATGAIATEREWYIRKPTYAFNAASTITDAVLLGLEGGPAQGTNGTNTRSWAMRTEGGLIGSSGQVPFMSGAASGSGTTTPYYKFDNINAPASGDALAAFYKAGTLAGSVQLNGGNGINIISATTSGPNTVNSTNDGVIVTSGFVEQEIGGTVQVAVQAGSFVPWTNNSKSLGLAVSNTWTNVWAYRYNGVQPADIANAASVTITVANGETQRILAGATNMTINGTAGNAGEHITVCVVQDATGGRTANFGTGSNNFALSGSTYTPSGANKRDCFHFAWDTGDTIWREDGRALNQSQTGT